jgi:hypothetical protein
VKSAELVKRPEIGGIFDCDREGFSDRVLPFDVPAKDESFGLVIQ